jgi:HEAT repeat protein
MKSVAENTAAAPPSSLLATLSGGNSPDLRATAATALGSFSSIDDLILPALIAALKDPEPKVRAAAASALGQLGPKARPALPALISVMNEPYVPPPAADRRSRGTVSSMPNPGLQAALAIGSMAMGDGEDDGPVRALDEALRSGHPSSRAAAARALFSVGKRASSAVSTLITTLVDGSGADEGYESWAARALGRAAPGTELTDRTVEALSKGLYAKAGGTRGYSAEALGHFGRAASGALPRLRELLGDRDGFVARSAKAAIDQIEVK